MNDFEELKQELINRINETWVGDNGEAQQEFERCVDALEGYDSLEIIEALQEGPLGCMTESSLERYDTLNIQDLATKVCNVLEATNEWMC